MNSPSKTRSPSRKDYRKPSLVQYGDLMRITKNVGMSGAKDGGMKPTGRTGP